MNFRYKLMQFMQGRYGIDGLFYVLFGTAAIMAIINFFLHSLILQLVIDVIIVYAFFRVLSRNYHARLRENQAFSALKNKILKKRNTYIQRKADYNHVYKKCPRCHAVLRLPRRKGKHTTVCPKCEKKFKVYVFKA